MSRLVTMAVALAIFLGIAVVCTRHHASSIRSAAVEGARQQLQAEGGALAGVLVSHPGRRSIDLAGVVDRPADRVLAEHLVRSHPLVAMVENRIQVRGAAEGIADWTGRELLAEDSFESGALEVGAGMLEPSPSTRPSDSKTQPSVDDGNRE